MPERNEKKAAPKPPALDPNLQKSIAAFRKENTPARQDYRAYLHPPEHD